MNLVGQSSLLQIQSQNLSTIAGLSGLCLHCPALSCTRPTSRGDRPKEQRLIR
jgi:hypothetical protein